MFILFAVKENTLCNKYLIKKIFIIEFKKDLYRMDSTVAMQGEIPSAAVPGAKTTYLIERN